MERFVIVVAARRTGEMERSELERENGAIDLCWEEVWSGGIREELFLFGDGTLMTRGETERGAVGVTFLGEFAGLTGPTHSSCWGRDCRGAQSES